MKTTLPSPATLLFSSALAHSVPVGSGSYTASFPGVDEAGRQ